MTSSSASQAPKHFNSPHPWVLVLHHSRTRTPEPEVVGWVSVSSTRRCLVALSPQKTALQAGRAKIGSLVEMIESEDPKVGLEMVAAQSPKSLPQKILTDGTCKFTVSVVKFNRSWHAQKTLARYSRFLIVYT